MTLTKRHFIAMAKILADHRVKYRGDERFDDLVGKFMDYFSTENDLFDWGRFKAAVYGKGAP